MPGRVLGSFCGTPPNNPRHPSDAAWFICVALFRSVHVRADLSSMLGLCGFRLWPIAVS